MAFGRRAVLAGGLCGAFVWGMAFSQGAERTAGRWALLIGVDDYTWARKLEYCGADMRALSRQLAGSGFPRDHVYLLHDAAEETRYRPTKANIESHLKLVLELVNPGDLLLVGFSGHGVELNGKSYLCPADARLEAPDSLISLDTVYGSLDRSAAALKLFLVDACRDDPHRGGERTFRPTQETRAFAQSLEQPPKGILLLTSCGPGEVAREDPEFRHGVFMHFLLEGLRGAADANRNGKVSLMELYLYTNDRTKSHVAHRFTETQRPALRGDIHDDFELAGVLTSSGSGGAVSVKPWADSRRIASALSGPQTQTKTIVAAAVRLLPAKHVSRHPLDARVAQRWVNRYLAALDPQKQYLRQADVDRVNELASGLPAQAEAGDISWAYDVFRIYLGRVEECQSAIEEILAAPSNRRAEDMVVDADRIFYAADEGQARERWRQRLQWQLLEAKVKGAGEGDARRNLQRRYAGQLRQMQRISDDGLLELCLSALAGAYDPTSNYMSPYTMSNYQSTTREQLEGIGVSLRMFDGELTVDRIVPGGPAARDGRLKAADRIVAVAEGTTGHFREVADLLLGDCVGLIRGRAGSTVRLKVVTRGAAEPVVYDFVRGRVVLAEVKGDVIEHGQKRDGKPFRVGYISIPSLYSQLFNTGEASAAAGQAKTSTSDVRRLLAEGDAAFLSRGVDVVVLDLRANSGGVLTEALNLPGLFLGRMPVVQFKDGDGKIQHYQSGVEKAIWEGAVMVLTNRETGSGAELVAAALQDYGRGLVVGDSGTAGNGLIQSIFDLGKELFREPNPVKLGVLKITTAQFFRLNGRSIQIEGVAPDLVLPSLTEPLRIGFRYQRDALAAERIAPLSFTPVEWVNEKSRRELQTRSEKRRIDSPEFAELRTAIERLARRSQRVTQALDEASVREAIEPVTGPKLDETGRFPKSCVEREIMEIARDYWKLLYEGN